MNALGGKRAALAVAALGATLIVPSMAQAATAKWAVVDSAGSLVRSNGGVAASTVRFSTGTYQVAFNADVTACGYVATAGDIGAGAVSGAIQATVAQRAGNPNALFIQTFDQATGAVSDQPFHVVVHCAKDLFAVVDATGVTARGFKVTSSAHLSTGQYEVIFTKNVSKCAFTASPGTTGAGTVGVPGEITVAGRNGNKKGVFVRILDRAGASLDASFHLSATCGKKNLAAVVDTTSTTATLARGQHVVSVAKLSATANDGRYEVIFDRTVSSCAYTVTVGLSGSTGSIGDPVVTTSATRSGNPNGVFVFIHRTSGATADEPFHLTVFC